MSPEEFAKSLQQGQYAPAVQVEQAAHYYRGDHSHPFDARALITAGEITLTVAGRTQCYPTGSIFELPRGTVHEECAGPQGVTYLAGRRTD